MLGVNAQSPNSLINVDYKSLVSKADLNYDTPVFRSEEGMPVGNGHMGSLVWTTPNAMHFQINRVDVFAMGHNTTSFRDGHTNYANGCGYIDINMVDYGDDVFSGSAFNQHLSVYEGLTTVKGKGVNARVLAWSNGDVIATEIDDQRATPSVINIDLRMLRYAINFIDGKNWELTSQHAIQIKQWNHTSTSRFVIVDGKIVLVQEFKEGDYYNASAVAIGIVGRESKATYYNESTVRLSAKPGKGSFVILTSSASSFDPKEDIVKLALDQMNAAQRKNFDSLVQDNRTWWGDYWTKSLVSLRSADGVANEVEKNHTYYLYVMGSCSREDNYMPGFRGMLWYTNGDLAMWGSQYWWNNQGTYFNGLTPVNRPGILAPVFYTFSKHYDAYATAARQQWGSKGIWIPETTWFNGPETLPDNIANEMRDLYLAKKPWKDRSKEFMDFAETKNDLNSSWNWLFLRRSSKTGEDGSGPFAWTSHIMSSTAKVAYVFWLNYAYHLDKEWLKETGYPVIKGVVEFYSNFPNLVKEPDGKYHLHYVNNLESSWGGKDTPEELLAMRAMIPIAIRCAEILGVDNDRRVVWKEILDNLTPIPVSTISAEYYDYCNLGIQNSELFKTTTEAFKRRNASVNESTVVRVLARTAVAAANLGLTEDVRFLIPAQIRSSETENCDVKGTGESGMGVLRNRLMLREGPGAIECERLGLASQALCAALLQSVPPTPGEEPINYIFPAWPKEWDAQFTLAARNAFKIGASMKGGQIEFVEIQSTKGGQCRIQNPWGNKEATIYRNGKRDRNISGKLLNLSSKVGETIVLVPKGGKLPVVNI